MNKTLQPRYVIKPETFKHSSILRGYNKWYITILKFLKETTNPDKMEIKCKLFLHGMTWAEAYDIEYNTIGSFKTSDSDTPGYYIV